MYGEICDTDDKNNARHMDIFRYARHKNVTLIHTKHSLLTN